MNRNHYFIIFLLIMTVGIGFYVVANQGWYPLVIVNSNLISVRTWAKQSDAAARYYVSALNSRELSPEARKEIERAALDKMIENILVYDGIKDKSDEADKMVSDKLTALNLDQEKVGVASNMLYGLNFDDFMDLVLLPMARREVLTDYLAQKEKTDFSQWLGDIKSKAKITLLTTRFRWDGGKIELSK